ncbi:MAG: MFS transporter, partial [Muribaculaceae bacterium]|nr:MFS transporter [Muribaculaceae bacterium]
MAATTKHTTQIQLTTMPLGWRHIRIVLIASLGQFLGQGLATLVGIVIPLMQLASRPDLPAALQGLMGCIS